MGSIFKNGEDTPENRKLLQDGARHQMIARLLADISMDLQVCELEGWDKTEYIGMIQEMINSFKVKHHGTGTSQL